MRQIFKALLLEAGKLTSKEFKLYIPDLMVKYKSDSPSEITDDISSKIVNGSDIKHKKLKHRNYVEATSATDYPIRLEGVNSWKMESAQGVVTTEVAPGSQDHTDDPEVINPVIPTIIQGIGVGTGGAIPGPVATSVTVNVQHSHKIVEPMQFTGMELTNLYNFDTKVGDIAIVFRVDESDFQVTQIKGYIPQDGDEVDNFWGR